MVDKKKYVEIGKIVAPHGVRGEVRVVSLSEFDEQVEQAQAFYLDQKGWLSVEGIRYHKNFILIKFAEVNDMDAAGLLRNKSIYLTREQIGDLPEGRYYIDDLLGLEVFHENGDFLGKLAEVITTGSNDVYIIKKEGQKDSLLPALKTVIKSTDIAAGKMIVVPPVWEDD